MNRLAKIPPEYQGLAQRLETIAKQAESTHDPLDFNQDGACNSLDYADLLQQGLLGLPETPEYYLDQYFGLAQFLSKHQVLHCRLDRSPGKAESTFELLTSNRAIDPSSLPTPQLQKAAVAVVEAWNNQYNGHATLLNPYIAEQILNGETSPDFIDRFDYDALAANRGTVAIDRRDIFSLAIYLKSNRGYFNLPKILDGYQEYRMSGAGGIRVSTETPEQKIKKLTALLRKLCQEHFSTSDSEKRFCLEDIDAIEPALLELIKAHPNFLKPYGIDQTTQYLARNDDQWMAGSSNRFFSNFEFALTDSEIDTRNEFSRSWEGYIQEVIDYPGNFPSIERLNGYPRTYLEDMARLIYYAQNKVNLPTSDRAISIEFPADSSGSLPDEALFEPSILPVQPD